MANSLGFLNKPTAAKSTIGPKPKPASKSPFLDTNDPWRVGGNTLAQTRAPAAKSTRTRASTVQTTRSQASPVKATSTRTRASTAGTSAKQTVTRAAKPATTQATAQRAAVPSRGYNYTDASYTGASPYERAGEVDRAQMSAQATAQRREATARRRAADTSEQRAQEAKPTQAVAYRAPAGQATGVIMPEVYTRPVAQAAQLMQQSWEPAVQAGQRAIAPAMRALNSWIQTMGGGQQQPTPEQTPLQWPQQGSPSFYSADARFAEWEAAQQAAQQAARATQQTAAQAPPTSRPTAATNAAPQVGGTVPLARAGEPLFYGYRAPGVLRGEFGMPSAQSFTELGARAMLPDTVIVAEGMRQGDGFVPWDSLSDAEKYQRRFGVAPQGAQVAPDYSRVNAAIAAANEQHERLVGEYWDRYSAVLGWKDAPLGAYAAPAERGQELIQRGPSGAAGRTLGTGVPVQALSAAPVAVQAATMQRAQAPVTNDELLLQVNPQAAQSVSEADVTQVAREISRRYMPEKDMSTLSLMDISAILIASYTPPPDMEEQYADDLEWLAQFMGSETP